MAGESRSPDEQDAVARWADHFIAERARQGTPRDQIVPMLIHGGIDEAQAQRYVDTRYDVLAQRLASERWSWSSLVPAAAGGLAAALLGGVAWAWLVRTTDYEIGFAAFGIGYLAGLAVLFLARGRRGVPLQLVAVAAAVLGVLLGKYLTYVGDVRDAVTAEFGAGVADEVSATSTDTLRFFFEDRDAVFSMWDLLWAGLAVLAAWRVPREQEPVSTEDEPWLVPKKS